MVIGNALYFACACAAIQRFQLFKGKKLKKEKERKKKLHGETARCLMWILIIRFRKFAILWKVVFLHVQFRSVWRWFNGKFASNDTKYLTTLEIAMLKMLECLSIGSIESPQLKKHFPAVQCSVVAKVIAALKEKHFREQFLSLKS